MVWNEWQTESETTVVILNGGVCLIPGSRSR